MMIANALSFDQTHDMPIPPQAKDVKCVATLSMPTLPKVKEKSDLFMKIPEAVREKIKPILDKATHERELVAKLDEVLEQPTLTFEHEGVEYKREGYSKWVDYAVAYWKVTRP